VIPKLTEGSIFLAIGNTACQAYCSKTKRIRPLKQENERLFANLLRAQEKQLVARSRPAASN